MTPYQYQQPAPRLKRHHKIVIGSFSLFLIGLLIANTVLIYILYGKLQYDYTQLTNELESMQGDTQTKISEVTSAIIKIRDDINSLNAELGTIDEEFTKLKASTSADFSGIIDQSIKGVVTVRTNVNQGTGFLISEEGYIITNYHIIEGATSAGIYTYEGNIHPVSLIGYDSLMDLALLKINGTYQELALGNSDDTQVGEKVIAIGNPLGLQFSVSEGIVSAVDRPGPNNLNVYIQTDAALNPGNSGGPLINKEGEVLGINNFKIGTGENLGFALESNEIKKVVNNIAQEELNQTLV